MATASSLYPRSLPPLPLNFSDGNYVANQEKNNVNRPYVPKNNAILLTKGTTELSSNEDSDPSGIVRANLTSRNTARKGIRKNKTKKRILKHGEEQKHLSKTEELSNRHIQEHSIKPTILHSPLKEVCSKSDEVPAVNTDDIPGQKHSTSINRNVFMNKIKLNKKHSSKNVKVPTSKAETFESSKDISYGKKVDLAVVDQSLIKGNIASQPVGKVFVEEERGFRAVDSLGLNILYKNTTTSENESFPQIKYAMDLAIKTERFFHTFSTLCHGLLAGMALWQCIIIYQLGPPHFDSADFISHYSALSQPIQTLFYFLFMVCTVSAFDRYDIGNPKWSEAKSIITCRSGVVIVLIYPASLFISLSIANTEDKFSLYTYNSTAWNILESEEIEDELFYWKSLNLARCIGAVLGFIIIALQPNINNFLHHLEHSGRTQKNNATAVMYSHSVLQ